jgi:hypothetical protein
MDRSYLPRIFYHDCSRILSSLPFDPSCLSFVTTLQYQPTPMHMKILVCLLVLRSKNDGKTKD